MQWEAGTNMGTKNVDILAQYRRTWRKQLQTPWRVSNMEALRNADFVGDQAYIDWWIVQWLTVNTIDVATIPLCVSESIRVDKKMRVRYKDHLRMAVAVGDTEFVKRHYLPEVVFNHWNVVDFQNIGPALFDVLWAYQSVPDILGEFVAQAQRMWQWVPFVAMYGPTECLALAVGQQWSEGVGHCLAEGAEIHGDIVGKSMCHPEIFRQFMPLNPTPTDAAWEDFVFKRRMGRIPNVPLVEEWFWIHGKQAKNTT